MLNLFVLQTSLFLSLFLGSAFLFASIGGVEDTRFCSEVVADEPPVSLIDFPFAIESDNGDFRPISYGLKQLKDLQELFYHSQRRISNPVYFDPSTETWQGSFFSKGEHKIKLPVRVILSIKSHIKEVFEQGYASALLMPDMGHSHLLIEEKTWKEKLKFLTLEKTIAEIIELLLQDPKTKLLYHTAEQVHELNHRQVKDNPEVQGEIKFRQAHRNIIGDLVVDENGNAAVNVIPLSQAESSSVNKKNVLEGYMYFQQGLYIHANQNGCFQVKVHDKDIKFDLSFDIVAVAQ